MNGQEKAEGLGCSATSVMAKEPNPTTITLDMAYQGSHSHGKEVDGLDIIPGSIKLAIQTVTRQYCNGGGGGRGGRQTLAPTPAHMWKLCQSPFCCDGIPGGGGRTHGNGDRRRRRRSRRGDGNTMTARKLAAALWETQYPLLHSFRSSSSPLPSPSMSLPRQPPSPQPPAPVPDALLPSKRSKEMRGGRRRAMAITALEPLQTEETYLTVSSPSHSLLSSYVEASSEGESFWNLKDTLKLMGKVRAMEDKRIASMSLRASLRLDLKQARAHLRKLRVAYESACKETESLIARFAGERESLQSQEEARAREAVCTLSEEVEREKAGRRRAEHWNRKLSRELSRTNAAMAKVVQELESEREARASMEDVCRELTKEIGQDKEEIELLKREVNNTREEVEEERKMLHTAHVWREERAQMKLVDAKHEMEERALAMDWLGTKLQEFIETHVRANKHEYSSATVISQALRLQDALNSLRLHNGTTLTYQSSETGFVDGVHLTEQINENFNQRHGWMSQGTVNNHDNSDRDMLWSQSCHESYIVDWDHSLGAKHMVEGSVERGNLNLHEEDGKYNPQHNTSDVEEKAIECQSEKHMYENIDVQLEVANDLPTHILDLGSTVPSEKNRSPMLTSIDNHYARHSTNNTLPNTKPHVMKGIKGFIGWSKSHIGNNPSAPTKLLEVKLDAPVFHLRDKIRSVEKKKKNKRSHSHV